MRTVLATGIPADEENPLTRTANSRLRVVVPYGVAHALVDASCAATVFYGTATERISPTAAASAVIVYNLLAFASQPLLGWFLTDPVTARTWARVGGAATAAAFFLSLLPDAFWVALVIAGLGNAVFHLGGGVVSLRLEPGRASLPGLFVAPGAAGLAAGIWMGTNQWVAWLPALALALTVPLLRTEEHQADVIPIAPERLTHIGRIAGAIGVIFLVVALRSLIGAGLALPWKSQPLLLWSLTAAVVMGKAFGGVLADRFGRIAVGVGALLLSAPLLIAGPSFAFLGIAGMFLFNMTMPVTLVALSDALPENPGFAFGLTCLALVVGALPMTMHLIVGLSPWEAGILAVGSAALLLMGLRTRSQPATRVSAEARPQEV